MERRSWTTHIPRTVALAAAVVASVVAGAWNARLLERLEPAEIAVLVLFAASFVALTLACDAELRTALRRAISFRTAARKSPRAKRAAI